MVDEVALAAASSHNEINNFLDYTDNYEVVQESQLKFNYIINGVTNGASVAVMGIANDTANDI